MRPTRIKTPLAAVLAGATLLILGSTIGCTALENPTNASPDLTTRIATRGALDQTRDAGRKPAAVLDFIGIEAGMTVVDVLAAGGYYTEVLSAAVGPDGKVYAQNIAFLLEMRDGINEKAIAARLAGNRLSNVERLDAEFDALGLAPNSIDAAITVLNIHDILDMQGPAATDRVLRTLKAALKPSGILGVIDHAGNAGADAVNKKLHRIDEARAVAAIEGAGFVIEASSDVLRNPADDRTQNVFAPGMRGNTDRFVLRARKPN